MPSRGELLGRAKAMRSAPTDAEQRLWAILRAKRLSGYKFKRQQPIGSFIVDFVCIRHRLIIEAAPVQETALTRLDVHTADECFLTGTAAEVIPVVKCDGRTIGSGKPGPITKQLRERFHQITRQ